MSIKLLRGGTLLVHDHQDHVVPMIKTDILIKGNKIVEIAQDIREPANTEVIDCTDKLISPGFVDTRKYLPSYLHKNMIFV